MGPNKSLAVPKRIVDITTSFHSMTFAKGDTKIPAAPKSPAASANAQVNLALCAKGTFELHRHLCFARRKGNEREERNK